MTLIQLFLYVLRFTSSTSDIDAQILGIVFSCQTTKKVRNKAEGIFKCHGNKSESNLVSVKISNSHTKDKINSYRKDFFLANLEF